MRAVERIGQGQSNLTFRLTLAGGELILRRPPPGPLPPSAHDVLREYRLLEALAGSAVPVPRPLASCADPAVLGLVGYALNRLFLVVEHWVLKWHFATTGGGTG